MNAVRWPARLEDGDPCGDRTAVDWATAWRYHQLRRGADALPEGAFLSAGAEFLEAVAACREGRVSVDPVPLARALGVWGPHRHDPRVGPVAERAPDTATLARITLDDQPGWGGEAPDRFLGTWADQLSVRFDAHRRALLHAVAAACFLVSDDDRVDVSPHHQWRRGVSKPRRTEREAVFAVERAPLALWSVVDVGAAGWRLGDATGIHPGLVPDGWVRVAPPGAVFGGEAPVAGLLARVVPTRGGWVAPIAWAVPEVPPPRLVHDWMLLETLVLRLDAKHVSLEQVLRDRSHLLVRRVHEWLT